MGCCLEINNQFAMGTDRGPQIMTVAKIFESGRGRFIEGS